MPEPTNATPGIYGREFEELRFDIGDCYIVTDGQRWEPLELVNLAAERTALSVTLAETRERTRVANARHVEFQTQVHRAIADLVSNDELDRDTANEVLNDLGLDRLAVEYTVEVVVSACLTIESTLDADDLCSAVGDSMPDIEWNDYGSDWSVEVVDAVNVEVQEVSEG